jgi:hypothetical protein
MPPEISSLLSIAIALIAAFGTVAFVIAFVGNRNRGLSEVQNSTIMAQQAQIDTQEKQIKALEKKLVHLNRVVLTVEYALKRRGLRIEIDEDAITLIDERTRANQTVQIRMMEAMHHQEEDKDA